MVQLKDIVVGIFSRYYWGIALVGGLLVLLGLVIIPNTDYIFSKMGIETKTSLRADKALLNEKLTTYVQANERINQEMIRLQILHDKQLSIVTQHKKKEVVIQEKIRTVVRTIPIKTNKETTKDDALSYYTALENAHRIAMGDENVS